MEEAAAVEAAEGNDNAEDQLLDEAGQLSLNEAAGPSEGEGLEAAALPLQPGIEGMHFEDDIANVGKLLQSEDLEGSIRESSGGLVGTAAVPDGASSGEAASSIPAKQLQPKLAAPSERPAGKGKGTAARGPPGGGAAAAAPAASGARPAAAAAVATAVATAAVAAAEAAAGAAAAGVAAGPRAQTTQSELDALRQQQLRQEQQLKIEIKARAELEDMLLRIEKHFKAEQAARKKAEEQLQAAGFLEADTRQRLEEQLRRQAQGDEMLDMEKDAVKREREALEGMRQEFENELQAARNEVAKAQGALHGAEDRVRAGEQQERARLEAEYQARLAALAAELDRTREELSYRTAMFSDEMTRWRQQAQVTAAAVIEAKNEVMERKRELDLTKERMDRLVDKLYAGREKGLELQGSIAAAQYHSGAASNQFMLQYQQQQQQQQHRQQQVQLQLQQQQQQRLQPGAGPSGVPLLPIISPGKAQFAHGPMGAPTGAYGNLQPYGNGLPPLPGYGMPGMPPGGYLPLLPQQPIPYGPQYGMPGNFQPQGSLGYALPPLMLEEVGGALSPAKSAKSHSGWQVGGPGLAQGGGGQAKHAPAGGGLPYASAHAAKTRQKSKTKGGGGPKTDRYADGKGNAALGTRWM